MFCQMNLLDFDHFANSQGKRQRINKARQKRVKKPTQNRGCSRFKVFAGCFGFGFSFGRFYTAFENHAEGCTITNIQG